MTAIFEGGQKREGAQKRRSELDPTQGPSFCTAKGKFAKILDSPSVVPFRAPDAVSTCTWVSTFWTRQQIGPDAPAGSSISLCKRERGKDARRLWKQEKNGEKEPLCKRERGKDARRLWKQEKNGEKERSFEEASVARTSKSLITYQSVPRNNNADM